MKNKQVLVFDFDGTLVDTFEMVMGIIGSIAGKFGMKPWAETEIAQFQNQSAQTLMNRIGVDKLVMPLIYKEVIKEQNKNIESMTLVPGLLKVLKQLAKAGYRMGILTSNSEANVRKYLEYHRLQNLFEFVYETDGLFGKEKTIAGLLDDHKLNAEQLIYFGDETRDVEAAHKAGVKVVAVTWGYQKRQILAELKPDWIIDRPNDLMKIFPATWWQQLFSRFF